MPHTFAINNIYNNIYETFGHIITAEEILMHQNIPFPQKIANSSFNGRTPKREFS